MEVHDLVIIGGGPAGLAAAINGASEGLDVLLMDAGHALGGQARESASIENYPGFPDGITGEKLMSALAQQAMKFQTKLAVPAMAIALSPDGPRYKVTDNYGEIFHARTILLANGLAYRRLKADGVGQFMGRGIYYGVPNGLIPTAKCTACVVGGANSAGQAVLNLARNPRISVRLLVRHKLADQMSDYLIKRILTTENITVMEDTEVIGCDGGIRLNAVWTNTGEEIPADFLYIYIGAVPQTYWLPKVMLDAKGFVKTWTDNEEPQDLIPYETTWSGVFAAGDIRLGSVKRIASACGEGAAALQMIHKRLGDR